MTGTQLERQGRFLIARLGRLHRVLSFAVVRGGFVETETVAWCGVGNDELRPPVDAKLFLARQLAAAGLDDAVGLMTSAALDTYVHVTRAAAGLVVGCTATVGLDNALRAGDPFGHMSDHVGTINVLCCASVPLADGALIEMLSLVAEARTMAVLEGGVRSRRSGLAATGTGTDCIVVAAPCGEPATGYAGKHTALGHLIGASVGEAVARGVSGWIATHGPRHGAGGAS